MDWHTTTFSLSFANIFMESTVVTFLAHQLFCFCVFLRLTDWFSVLHFYQCLIFTNTVCHTTRRCLSSFFFNLWGRPTELQTNGLKHKGRIGLPSRLHTQQTHCSYSACCKDCSNKECMINSRKLTLFSCIMVKTSTAVWVGSQGGRFYKTILQGAIPRLFVKGSHGRWSVVMRVCVCVM